MSKSEFQKATFGGWTITFRQHQAISAAGAPYGAKRGEITAIHENSKDPANPMLLVLRFDTYDRPGQKPLEDRLSEILEPILSMVNSEMLPF